MATYYISTVGSDSNVGTSVGEAWRNISKANATLTAGDTVYIMAGTYHDVIEPANNGTSGSRITYAAYSGQSVTIDGVSTAKHGVVFLGGDPTNNQPKASGSSYITVDGFTLTYQYWEDFPDSWPSDVNRFAYVYIDRQDSVGNTIRNCNIILPADATTTYSNWYRQKGVLDGGTYTTVENCTISGFWIGLYSGGDHERYLTVRNCYFYNMGSSCIDIGSMHWGNYDTFNRVLIENNVLSGSVNEDAIQFEPDYDSRNTSGSYHLYVSNKGTVIRNNIMCYNVENAVDMKGGGYIVIEGNIIYGHDGNDDGGLWEVGFDNRWSGTAVGVGSYEPSTHVIIRNNIIYDNLAGISVNENKEYYHIYNNSVLANNRDYTGPNSSYTGGNPGFCGLFSWGGSYATVKNNIFAEHFQGDIGLATSGVSNWEVDHNLYKNNGRSDNFVNLNGGGQSYLTFGAWKSALGKDTNSLTSSASPFVNVPQYPTGSHTQYDFNISTSSLAYNNAGPLTYVSGTGTGATITLDDATMFSDGYGVVAGDLVNIGNDYNCRISSVDYDANTITLTSSISYSDNDPVWLSFIGSGSIGATAFSGSNFGTTGSGGTEPTGSSGTTPVLVASDGWADASGWTTATMSASFTVPAGDNRLLVVTAGGWGGANKANTTSATWNGTAMTKSVYSDEAANMGTQIWYLVAPATGTHDIVVTWSDVIFNRFMGASAYTGVHQTSTIGNITSEVWDTGAGTSHGLTLASATGQLVIDSIYIASSTCTAAGGQTSIYKLTDDDYTSHASSWKSGSASTTTTYTTADTFGAMASMAINGIATSSATTSSYSATFAGGAVAGGSFTYLPNNYVSGSGNRYLNRVVMAILDGNYIPDTGLSVTIRTEADELVCTAIESGSTGNYEANWATQQAYGYWYIGSTKMEKWGKVWLGEVVGDKNLPNTFTINKDTYINGDLQVNGSFNATIFTASYALTAENVVGVDKAHLAYTNVDNVFSVDQTVDGKVVINPGDGYLNGEYSYSDDLVVSNPGTQATTLITPETWVPGSVAKIRFGDIYHTIQSKHSEGITFATVDTLRLQGDDGVHVQSALTVSSSATFKDNITVNDDNTIGSPTFASGFGGSGWRLDSEVSSSTGLELDKLTVRGTMRVYELLINQIRATNGSVWVSSCGKVSGSTYNAGPANYSIVVDSGNGMGHPFATDDILLAQRWDRAGNSVYQSVLAVVNASTTASFTAELLDGIAPAAGMEYVRIGNATDTDRQGSVYLTADDSHAPFIRVYDGVNDWATFGTQNTVKAQMGKLDGLTDATFGTLSGYGFYASGSAYLAGSINATSGKIAGWNITGSAISKTSGSGGSQKGIGISMDDGLASHNPNIAIYRNADGSNFMTLGGSQFTGTWLDDTWGMNMRFNSQNLFQCFVPPSGVLTASIAGWNFDSQRFYKNISSSYTSSLSELNSSTQKLMFTTISASLSASAFVKGYAVVDDVTCQQYIQIDPGLFLISGSNSVQVYPDHLTLVSPGGSARIDPAAFKVNDIQVVGTRKTGWSAPSGAATRSTFATSTVTTEQLAERVKALIDDLTSHGLIGS